MKALASPALFLVAKFEFRDISINKEVKMKNVIKISLFAMSMLVSSISVANQISPDFLKEEIKFAHSQYLKGSPESGLYALQALARVLESDQSSSLKSKVGPNNLSFTYLRIGLIYKKLGSESEASEYFNKATITYKGEKVEIAQLREIVV
jgi:hypothetical protein